MQFPQAYRFGCAFTLPLIVTLRRGDNTAVGDEYFNRRVGTLFSIHLRYFLCVEKTVSAYCFTNSTIVAVFFVYGKSSVDAVRFPSQEFPLH